MDRISNKSKSASVASIKSKFSNAFQTLTQMLPGDATSPVDPYGKTAAPQTYNFLNEIDMIKIVASKIDIVLPLQSLKPGAEVDLKRRSEVGSQASQPRVKSAISPRSLQSSVRNVRRFADSKSMYSGLTAASQMSMVSGISYNLKKPAEFSNKV
jgi:hypothetical protein